MTAGPTFTGKELDNEMGGMEGFNAVCSYRVSPDATTAVPGIQVMFTGLNDTKIETPAADNLSTAPVVPKIA